MTILNLQKQSISCNNNIVLQFLYYDIVNNNYTMNLYFILRAISFKMYIILRNVDPQIYIHIGFS